MKMRTLASTCAAVAFAFTGLSASAEPVDDQLVINGETEIVTRTDKAPDYIDGLSEQYSGWHFREDDTRDMQRDDFDNPGTFVIVRKKTPVLFTNSIVNLLDAELVHDLDPDSVIDVEIVLGKDKLGE